jgi:hypothetical protein
MTSPDPSGPRSRPAVPQYGEYAPPGDPRFAPPPPAPAPVAPTPPTARPRDAIASGLLIGLGFVMTVQVVFLALDLEGVLTQAYAVYGGTGDYSPANDLRFAGAVLAGSHVILFAASLLLTRSLVARRRLSFWVPLAAGVIASAILFVTMGALISADSELYSALMEFMTPPAAP